MYWALVSMKCIQQGEEQKKSNLVISMNRYGKPRNDNYMVNICDDVVLFKHTHKDSVKKTNKMCKKKMAK